MPSVFFEFIFFAYWFTCRGNYRTYYKMSTFNQGDPYDIFLMLPMVNNDPRVPN